MLRKPFSIGILLSLVVLLIFTATYHSRKTLEGRVFIVTRSAENIKLGLVSIYIFTEEQTKTHLTNVNLITKGQLTDLQLRLFVLNALYDATNKLRDDLRSAQQESSKATAEAAKSGELKIQGYTSHPTTTIRPDAEYKEQTRRLRLDYHYITTSSYTVYSKTAEQEVRQKLVLLTKQQADVDRRQKLWEQWDPIWQKHYSVTQNLSNQIVNVVTSLAAITDLIDRQKRLLSKWPDLAEPYYLDNLPTPVLMTKTDADGRFSLRLPSRGKFAIAAKAEREVFTGSISNSEKYYWFVWITPNKNDTFLLSNDNMLRKCPIDAVVFLRPN